ncbi:uncharacterized protein LOC141661050 isoform X2 [Apium graveolens]|uniref:uncharacterized protein LOC141661050 isoform X2 n=1 Tax=Apium graveolens TaxID=4045 RepID=UPI003D792AFC
MYRGGATPETRAWDPVPSRKISSLDYALEILSCDRNLINWNPKKSVFKLIITLCLPQLKQARETIALLAGFGTTIDILNDAIFNGQVVPVAALLLVARKKVLRDLYFFGDNVSSGPLTFPRAIMNELAAVINQKYALLGREEHTEILQLCLEEKELMLYFLQMLEIFEKAGSKLDLYLKFYADKTEPVPNEEVSCEVGKLLENAGFTLSQLDYLDSPHKPEPVPSDIEMEEQEHEDDSNEIWFSPVRKQLCLCDVKNVSCSTSKVFHRLLGQSFLHGQYCGFSSHAGPSAYHHSWTIPSKIFGRVEPLDKSGTTVKEESSKWVSKRVARFVPVLLAALKRRAKRAPFCLPPYSYSGSYQCSYPR